jgi:hypothetical protein
LVAAKRSGASPLPLSLLTAASAFVEKSPKRLNAFAWLGRVATIRAETTKNV